jgi:glycosyltransferase involved in cell wall biosynthesis
MTMKLYCVVPFYNEETYLPACVDSLLTQTDADFNLVFVDNGSTDASADVVKKFIADHPQAELITEEQKGTGSAADTGFRHAIAQGATHIARTDADCVADREWITKVKQAFAEGTELVLGYPSYRRDAPKATIKDFFFFPLAVWLSDLHGLLFWRGPQYKTTYRIGAGNNMAITTELYQQAGGFPRRPLDEQDDDVVLFDAARKLTPHIKRYRSVRSYASLRRPRKYGYLRAMLYYWDRKYQPKEVDVR